jgi:hypothetical protein
MMTLHDDMTILFEHVNFFFTWLLFFNLTTFFQLDNFFHHVPVATLPLLQLLRSPSSSRSAPPCPVAYKGPQIFFPVSRVSKQIEAFEQNINYRWDASCCSSRKEISIIRGPISEIPLHFHYIILVLVMIPCS